MKITNTRLGGLMICNPVIFSDHRGDFVKTFHHETFAAAGIDFQLRESMYSISKVGVLRGMHFQNPPHACAKLVYCLQGSVLDVVVDLRSRSTTYGQFHTEQLSAANHCGLFVPEGFAHGFLALEDNSLVAYGSSAVFAPESDNGIRYDSFGYDWPVTDPVLSGKDLGLINLSDFESPF